MKKLTPDQQIAKAFREMPDTLCWRASRTSWSPERDAVIRGWQMVKVLREAHEAEKLRGILGYS
jgi:hypothetical protein